MKIEHAGSGSSVLYAKVAGQGYNKNVGSIRDVGGSGSSLYEARAGGRVVGRFPSQTAAMKAVAKESGS